MFCFVLFPITPSRASRAQKLISSPYQNWKDAKSDLKAHGHLEYHRDSMALMNGFLAMMKKPSLTIENRLSSENQKQVEKNLQFLISIVKCLEFCGRQGIALRGHRDDSTSNALNQGNSKLCDAGDTALKHHLETCARSATYISKTSQNALLGCIKRYLQNVIVKQVKEGGDFFGISADEVTDVSNWEQLRLVIRYVSNGQPTEKLLEYIGCESCTGQDICSNILSSLEGLGLDPKFCRAQTYDRAGNMAGRQNGCAKLFQEVAQRALYFHCASHELNLALCHACTVPEIHSMVCTLQSLGYFFRFSPTAEDHGRKQSRPWERQLKNQTPI